MAMVHGYCSRRLKMGKKSFKEEKKHLISYRQQLPLLFCLAMFVFTGILIFGSLSPVCCITKCRVFCWVKHFYRPGVWGSLKQLKFKNSSCRNHVGRGLSFSSSESWLVNLLVNCVGNTGFQNISYGKPSEVLLGGGGRGRIRYSKAVVDLIVKYCLECQKLVLAEHILFKIVQWT